MQVIVQGQQLDVGEALRFHVQEKLTDTCTKYFNHSIQGNVHFAREASGYRTDITLSVGNGILLKATASDPMDPYPAFDQANSRLVKQLKKYKERLKDHHAEQGKSTLKFQPANEYTFTDRDAIEHGEGGDAPVTLAELPTHVPILTVADAVMRMDLADTNALLFHHAGHGRLNMVYRRKDGNIGWVDPQEQTAKTQQKPVLEAKAPVKKPTAKKTPAKKKAVKKQVKKTAKKTAKKPAKKAKKAAPKKVKKRK